MSGSGKRRSSGRRLVDYVLMVNGFGEEIGWRGFRADGLLERHSRMIVALIVASVAIGCLPSSWRRPPDNGVTLEEPRAVARRRLPSHEAEGR